MPSERVVVSAEEIDRIVPETDAPPTVFQRAPSPIPLWAKIALSLLVPLLPLLCIVAVVLKLAFRTQPPSARHAMASLLSTLLIISGLRHANVRTTLGTYSHAVDANKLAAQGQFLNTLLSSERVQ